MAFDRTIKSFFSSTVFYIVLLSLCQTLASGSGEKLIECYNQGDVFDSVMYECTVHGTSTGTTVWRGSAFNCTEEEIVLLHQRFMFESGPRGVCNNGSIVAVGQSLGTNNECCTSTLMVRVTADVIGKSIECVHDEVGHVTPVGSMNISTHTGFEVSKPFVHAELVDASSRHIIFSWSPVESNSIPTHYNILSSNCGSCPTTTTNTTVTCTNVPTNGSTCTFAVQSIFCGSITGNSSNPLRVLLAEEHFTVTTTIIPSDSDNVTFMSAAFHFNYIAIIVLSLAVFFAIMSAVSTTVCVAALVVLRRKTKQLSQTTHQLSSSEPSSHNRKEHELQQLRSSEDNIVPLQNIAYSNVTIK